MSSKTSLRFAAENKATEMDNVLTTKEFFLKSGNIFLSWNRCLDFL